MNLRLTSNAIPRSTHFMTPAMPKLDALVSRFIVLIERRASAVVQALTGLPCALRAAG